MQTKLESFIESAMNMASGMVLAYFTQLALNLYYEVDVGYTAVGWYVFWHTVVSFTRSYVLRRFFNRRGWTIFKKKPDPAEWPEMEKLCKWAEFHEIELTEDAAFELANEWSNSLAQKE